MNERSRRRTAVPARACRTVPPPCMTGMRILLSSSLLLGVLLGASFAPAAEQGPEPTVRDERVTVEDVIPLTVGNLRGHKMLYNEGWFIVTSSGRALEFAREHALLRSRDAVREAAANAASRGKDYTANLRSDAQSALEGGSSIVRTGTELTGDILRTTHSTGKAELAYASESFHRAGESFIKGNLSLGQRTGEDRKELAALPGKYFSGLKDDFSNIWELTSTANDKFAGRIEVGWDKAFDKAASEFKKEYDRSGESSNTLTALGPILSGYLKSIYHGIVAPSSKTIVKT